MEAIKKRTYMNVAVFGAIVLFSLYLGNVYMVEKIKELNEKIIQSKQEITQIESQNKQIEVARNAREKTKNFFKVVSDLVVDSEKVVDLIVELEAVAQKNKVKLKFDAAGSNSDNLENENKNSNKTNFSENYFDVSVSGSFNDVMHFLVFVENLKYYVDLENIGIKHIGALNSEENFREVIFKARLKAYSKDVKE